MSTVLLATLDGGAGNVIVVVGCNIGTPPSPVVSTRTVPLLGSGFALAPLLPLSAMGASLASKVRYRSTSLLFPPFKPGERQDKYIIYIT